MQIDLSDSFFLKFNKHTTHSCHAPRRAVFEPRRRCCSLYFHVCALFSAPRHRRQVQAQTIEGETQRADARDRGIENQPLFLAVPVARRSDAGFALGSSCLVISLSFSVALSFFFGFLFCVVSQILCSAGFSAFLLVTTCVLCAFSPPPRRKCCALSRCCWAHCKPFSLRVCLFAFSPNFTNRAKKWSC